MAEWQAAMEALILVAELGGPTMYPPFLGPLLRNPLSLAL